jgi:hypothetical protein
VIHIGVRNDGRLANRMFRYMYLRLLQDRLGPSRLTGYDMPAWNLSAPPAELPGRVLRLRRGMRHDPAAIAEQLNRGLYDSLEFGAYVQRLEYYPDRRRCAGFFPDPPAPDAHLRGPGHIAVHVRAADVVVRPHPYYGPVPPAFLEQVVTASGLTPVILGQLGKDAYSTEIRRRFAGCTILPMRSEAEDFAFLRGSTHIVLSASTFCWLAAWFSDTARQIHLPVQSLYDPAVASDIDLLPIGDARYRFYATPSATWTGTDDAWRGVLAARGPFAELSPAAVRARMP